MSIIAFLFIATASFLIISAAIAFFRTKDVFTMTHIVMITNTYIVPLILLSIELQKFSLVSFAKIITIIMLNIVFCNLICHIVMRRAIINNIMPEAEEKKK